MIVEERLKRQKVSTLEEVWEGITSSGFSEVLGSSLLQILDNENTFGFGWMRTDSKYFKKRKDIVFIYVSLKAILRKTVIIFLVIMREVTSWRRWISGAS